MHTYIMTNTILRNTEIAPRVYVRTNKCYFTGILSKASVDIHNIMVSSASAK